MARRRITTTAYSTYGSVAYAPAYDGSAVRAPGREEELYRQPQPRPRTHERVRQQELTRTQGQVREAGHVAPFAVVGFLAVAVFAVMLVLSYVQLTVLNGETVKLRSELTTLQAESATLSAQYELVFDMETVEAAVGGTMARPDSSQMIYIDLSEPDTVVLYGDEYADGMLSALSKVGGILGGVIEYFR